MPTAWLTSTLATPQQSGSIFAVDGMVQCVMAIHYGQKPMDPIHYERQVLAAKKYKTKQRGRFRCQLIRSVVLVVF